ncbi:MAG: PilZ domain-containing protein [Candidatus Omnitrophota bacterium]
MTQNTYSGLERRQFVRLDYIAPLNFKVCKKKTLSKLMEGYTADVSQAGLSCDIKLDVNVGDVLWVSFDRATLNICEDIERRVLIYQNGIIGKVARVSHKAANTYNVGLQFLVREEKNLSNIYPKIHFMDLTEQSAETADEEA